MTHGAFLYDPDFIAFPGGYFVDVFVAVLALDVVDKMGARIMLHTFFLMAPVAGDRLRMNFCSLCLDMGFNVCNVPVAAIAGIGSVNRLCELSFRDLIMAAKTFFTVDTLRAILSALDGEFLRFFPLIHMLR